MDRRFLRVLHTLCPRPARHPRAGTSCTQSLFCTASAGTPSCVCAAADSLHGSMAAASSRFQIGRPTGPGCSWTMGNRVGGNNEEAREVWRGMCVACGEATHGSSPLFNDELGASGTVVGYLTGRDIIHEPSTDPSSLPLPLPAFPRPPAPVPLCTVSPPSTPVN